MALNFVPDLLDTELLKGNLRSVARHLDFDHYVRCFQPGDFILSTAAGLTSVLLPAPSLLWPAISMPDALDSDASVSWAKPSEWRSGRFKMKFWYTSPVGSTNNFYIRTGVSAVRDTEVLPGTTLLSDDSAIAGPGVANTVIRRADLYTATSFGSDDELLSLRIRRIGAHASDTNVNEFYLLHVYVEHVPAAVRSQ